MLRLEAVTAATRDRDRVRALLRRHGVLHLTGFTGGDGGLTELAGWFGRPDVVFPREHQVPGRPVLRLQSNVPGLGANAGGQYWHADGSYAEVPTEVTLLHCIEAPAASGETLFADMRAAYRALDPELRELIDGRTAFYPCRRIAARSMAVASAMKTVRMSPEEQRSKLAELRDVHRPLVREQPDTGERALHLNERWLRTIDGLDEARGARVLSRLYATATAPQRLYRHRWTVGDLLIWDNYAVMHKAVPVAGAGRKVTHRATVAGRP
ncbi:hypothetical protein GCM10020358_60800 [Amorphoplanes nipponensis]|uniref:TauD/TfdA-like domain-containing protein n=1 Tax=Actinoplanes nipponensis TaxID=135950 RepID=A0A919MRN9_9ACTN|nr:TauD/TfdA family dioxygenase [Actinoplanes nipponensis]GIE54427.1 hypothetical protein Ani05nite_79610 [Actinoplanes nipponensis]